jgi:cellulose synthase operon protein C
MALAFRDDESLRVVLTSGLCPPEVQAKSARVARGANGAVILAPDQPLPAAAITALRRAGIEMDAKLPDGARAVRCWAEAIALDRVHVGQLPALVLVTTPDAAGVVELAAELLRLGCERQELLIGPAGGVVRVTDPPTYTMMRALDRDAGLRAYAPDPPGQDAVFTELGYRHPLATRLAADPGHLLLVGPDGWRSIEDRGWRGLDSALALEIPADRVELGTAPLAERRRIELRLAPGRREAPSLWVIRGGGLAAIDRMLAYLPEEVVGRLTFAATEAPPGAGPDARVIIVRARTSRHPPPDLSLDAEVYAPLAHLPDVYAPAGAIVEPPLRRERLRAILGIESGQVAWLAPLGPDPARGPFRVERISDAAFAPLAEWAEYVIHASASELLPWMRATTFDFAPFVSTGLEWASAPAQGKDEPAADARRAARPPRRRASIPAAPAPAPQPIPVHVQREAPAPEVREAAPRVEEVTIDPVLVRLENEFVAMDAPADAPERLDLLVQLGGAYTRLGRRRDAGLCFARAVWERTGPAAEAQLDAWITAELGRTKLADALDRALAQTQPGTDDVRRVAAIAARAPEPVRRDPHRVHRWLDDHDRELDARSMWLARVGLARLAGGDTLGLATTRDRILARLAGGLPVERELPSFLRFAGRSGALGNASGEQLGAALERLAERIQTTRRKRSPVEAPTAYTNAYVTLQLAHGFARIGQHERARALVAEARAALAAVINDPVHAYLVAAFAARVEQAIAGQPPETPLPEALGAQLAGLDRVARYKVDRLREASPILEPIERLDAIVAFSKKHEDGRGPEFAALRTMSDPAARAKEVRRLVGVAASAEETDQRIQLLDGCFDVMLELPEALAVPILVAAVPIVERLPEPRRAVLYAEALVVAGHFGRTELIPQLLDALGAAVRVVSAAELARVLDQSLRALRRIGLREEMAELLADAEHALAAAASFEHGTEQERRDHDHQRRLARLALAGGLAFLGDTARALPILEGARKALGDERTPMHRIERIRALARAYSQAPLGHALGGINELAGQLRDISDSYGTNSHYCLSVLHFVESLVTGITSDDLALGEVGRRFVEDDEHLIRRRLHRDLGGTH